MQWKWKYRITWNHVISPLKEGYLGRDNYPTGDGKGLLELGAETGVAEEQVSVHRGERAIQRALIHLQAASSTCYSLLPNIA
jgi:hypothetical protein